MDHIIPGTIKEEGGGLFSATIRYKNGATQVAYLDKDSLRKRVLKEEIFTLVGEVLWNQEIEKRIEEIEEIEWREGVESTLED
jgi:hypothetical protein